MIKTDEEKQAAQAFFDEWFFEQEGSGTIRGERCQDFPFTREAFDQGWAAAKVYFGIK